MRINSARPKSEYEKALDALASNIAPTDEELEANIREEQESYDWRIVRQRRAREEFEKRHGKKPV